jgi:hypothetical protein
VNESLPELIPFNQQVHQVFSDARPPNPLGFIAWSSRMDVFPFTAKRHLPYNRKA